MKRRITFLGAGALFLTLLPPALEAQFTNQDLQNGKKVVHSVLILPAQATAVKSGVNGDETLMEESRALEAGFTSEVASFLTGVGCNVLPSAFNDENLNQNPDRKYALADLQTRFDNVLDQVARNPKDVRTGRFTMGDEVANFNPGAAADALVFVRGEETVFTFGKKILDGLSRTDDPNRVLLLRIAFVDAQSGALLYVDWAAPKIVQRRLKKSFKKFGNPYAKKQG